MVPMIQNMRMNTHIHIKCVFMSNRLWVFSKSKGFYLKSVFIHGRAYKCKHVCIEEKNPKIWGVCMYVHLRTNQENEEQELKVGSVKQNKPRKWI